jgi:hypothetical protein
VLTSSVIQRIVSAPNARCDIKHINMVHSVHR